MPGREQGYPSSCLLIPSPAPVPPDSGPGAAGLSLHVIPAMIPEPGCGEPLTWFFHLADDLTGHEFLDLPMERDAKDIKWSDARRFVLARDSRACTNRSCGHAEDLTVHHILPRAWGGTHHPGNLITLCSRCHRNLCDSCTRDLPRRVPPAYYPP